MRIVPRVHLVGSGGLGFEMTHPSDCHVYLLDGGDEWALLDAGCGREPERIGWEIEQVGIDPARIAHLLLTHAHADHAGGAFFWREKTGAQVAASPLATDRLESGDETGVGLVAARAAGVYPPDYTLRACAVDRRLADGDVVRVGDLSIRVLETPGHSVDHLSFLVETPEGDRILFGGDVVFFGGRIILQNLPDCSLRDYAQSIAKLAAVPVTCLLPGHGAVSVHGGNRHVKRAADTFASLGVPDNLV